MLTNERSSNRRYMGKERRKRPRQASKLPAVILAKEGAPMRTRHSAITNDLYSVYRYKLWTRKIRDEWQPET